VVCCLYYNGYMPEEIADPRLQKAIDAIEKHDLAEARRLLSQLLKDDRDNKEAWLWMSAAVETVKERTYCLKELLRLDTANRAARFGLQMAGELPYDPSLAIPYEKQVRDWKKKYEPPQPPKKPKSRAWRQALIFVFLLAAFVVAGYYLVTLTLGRRSAKPTYMNIMRSTATPSATPSPGIGTPLGTAGGPAPLAMSLAATYTPTPLFMETPHPMLEAYSAGLRAYARGDWEEVIAYMQQVLQAEPGALDARYLIAEAYRFEGNYSRAISDYTDLIKTDANFAPAYLGRARARLAADATRWNECESDLRQAIKIDPDLGEAYLEMGAVQVEHDQVEDGLANLATAGQLLPDSPLVHYYRAIGYQAEGDLDLALEEAQAAFTLDITHLPTYKLMGELLQANDQVKESLEPLQTYVLYVQDDPSAYLLIGQAYASNGDNASALEAFDTALQLSPDDPGLRVQRGYAYLNLHDGQSALDDFEYAMDHYYVSLVSFDANLGKGRAYLELEQYGNAYIQFNKTDAYARSDAQKAQLYYWRALSLEGLGETNAAILEWNRMLNLPTGAVPEEWRATAREHIAELKLPTATNTLRPTWTLTPTRTLRPTFTLTPTRTPRPTFTRTPTP
jgi:tetratricopeptide (TPR) repeat protein